ncbi:hypothetical protein PRZ48_014061 [Zasmidium cellare]|uniref:DUF4185 domain-containing protein n=1 Tax=Zasmidium cellare TaxID=395010 RepID=A0ABR0DZX8_ZASCE|nr:hypothetical protein PRZ48_014061 [Zasmidium cellare]
MSSKFVSTSLIAAICSGFASGLAHLPPRVSGDPQQLGHTQDAAFSNSFYSDGGAGGKVNGYNLLTLSDARIPGTGPMHTVYAYAGTRNNDPTQITIIADYTENPPFYHFSPDGTNGGVIEVDSSDSVKGDCFGPGPNTAMVRIPGNQTGGVTIWSVFDACQNPPVLQYNTFIEFNVLDPDTLNSQNKNIPAQRTVLRLFNANEPQYGTDGLATDGTWYYLMALDNTGYKLARVAINDRTNRGQYYFYYPSTKQWTKQIHTLNDNSTTLYAPPPPNTGIFGSDFYYSPYFQTWLLTYSPADPYSAKYLAVAYSTSGNPEGPYTFAGTPFKPATDPECQTLGNGGNSYLVHSQPGFDESGATLLVSWISCNTFTNMARLTWAS